ncbi:MAG TPA: NmrA family NAD(P)-binding protein [Polyangiaceae bacterium]|nr:NmrA family NAD(P)-binding protein [Polyangiaceae bacterium]
MPIFVVAGATGHVGSVVSRELLAAGHKVRAIVRSVDKAKALAGQGAELLPGELSDVGFLTRALRGADGAFLLLPPPANDATNVRALQDRVAQVEATAVAESGVRHVVLLSSWGAEKPSGTGPIVGLHVLEEALKKTGAISTFLRAGSFTENLLHMLPAARHQGILPNFFPPELKLASLATRDIAAAAVRALLSPPAATEVVYVLGANEYSAVDQAAYLSKKLGKDIKLLNLPASAASGAIQQGGMGASMADLMQEMYEGAMKGLLSVEPGHRVEKGTTTLEQALDPYFAK